jgi:hypothetical protein
VLPEEGPESCKHTPETQPLASATRPETLGPRPRP